jgi:hypothetical protein
MRGVKGTSSSGAEKMLALTRRAVADLTQWREKAAQETVVIQEEEILQNLLDSSKSMMDAWASLLDNHQLKRAAESHIRSKIISGLAGPALFDPARTISVLEQFKNVSGAEYLAKTDRTSYLRIVDALISPFIRTRDATKRLSSYPDYLFAETLAFCWWKFLHELPKYRNLEGGNRHATGTDEQPRSKFHLFIRSIPINPAISDDTIRSVVERIRLYAGGLESKKGARKPL